MIFIYSYLDSQKRYLHLSGAEMEKEMAKDISNDSKLSVKDAIESGSLPYDYGILTQLDPGTYFYSFS